VRNTIKRILIGMRVELDFQHDWSYAMEIAVDMGLVCRKN
jgi:hypothetical protein